MKTSLKLLFVFITTILLFTSCDKDFYEDVELQKNNLESIDVKTITYDEFKRKLKSVENKPAVKMILNNTNSIRHFARSGDDSEIEIFTDVIKEITSGTYKSYTMYIKTSDTIASKFYNLTLEEKEGNTAAFITKYSPTENWLNDKNQPFEGDIRTFRVIEPGPGGSIKFTHNDIDVGGGSSYPFDCDGYVQTSIVLEPYQCGCGPEHWPWQTCRCTTSHPPGYTPNLYYECIPNNFGNPGVGNPGSGYSPAGGSSYSSSQPGEPSNNSLTTIVGEPIIRPSVLYLADLLSLNSRQITFLSNNPVVEAQISNYISENTDVNNVVNTEAMAFAQELINRAEQNPTFYASEKIINWFFTPNEGVDFEYDQDFWTNPNLTFPSQNLPTWDDYSNGYPTETGADNVYGSVGGQVWQTRLQYPNGTTNTCALKVSIALNNCDIIIPNIPGQTLQGANGKFYFLNARALNTWMRLTFGTNPSNPNHHEFSGTDGGLNGINFPNLLTNPINLRGIYSMVRSQGQITGHADILRPNADCLGGCNFQMSNIERIDIWYLD